MVDGRLFVLYASIFFVSVALVILRHNTPLIEGIYIQRTFHSKAIWSGGDTKNRSFENLPDSRIGFLSFNNNKFFIKKIANSVSIYTNWCNMIHY